MSEFAEHRYALKEVRDGSLAFFRETRNASANVEQANLGAKLAGRVIGAVGMDLRVALTERKLAAG